MLSAGKARPTENELKLKELIRYFVESNVSCSDVRALLATVLGNFRPINDAHPVFLMEFSNYSVVCCMFVASEFSMDTFGTVWNRHKCFTDVRMYPHFETFCSFVLISTYVCTCLGQQVQ